VKKITAPQSVRGAKNIYMPDSIGLGGITTPNVLNVIREHSSPETEEKLNITQGSSGKISEGKNIQFFI